MGIINVMLSVLQSSRQKMSAQLHATSTWIFVLKTYQAVQNTQHPKCPNWVWRQGMVSQRRQEYTTRVTACACLVSFSEAALVIASVDVRGALPVQFPSALHPGRQSSSAQLDNRKSSKSLFPLLWWCCESCHITGYLAVVTNPWRINLVEHVQQACPNTTF